MRKKQKEVKTLRIQPWALMVALDAWREPLDPARDRRFWRTRKTAAAAERVRAREARLDLAPFELPARERADAKRPADRVA